MKTQLLKLHAQINEEQAQFFLDSATNTVLALTNRKELLPQMETLVIQLASFLIQSNKRQGVTSRSEGAISESYADSTSIPNALLMQIQSYRLLRQTKYGSEKS